MFWVNYYSICHAVRESQTFSSGTLYFKIFTATMATWCHPTSAVAVTAANTAVCEHWLTSSEDPRTDPPPLPVQPPPRAPEIGHVASRACSGIRHERLSSSAAVRHRFPPPKPVSPPQPWANHGFYHLILDVCLWTWVPARRPRRFISYKKLFSSPLSDRRRFWAFFGIEHFWNPAIVC